MASSASRELLNDPSPSLLSSTRGGNSTSRKVGEGREKADLTEDMACLSRVAVVEGFEKRLARIWMGRGWVLGGVKELAGLSRRAVSKEAIFRNAFMVTA